MSEEGKFPVMPVVHTIIGLLIMFSGHFLPCPSLVVEATEKLQALNLPAAPDGGLTLSVTRIGMKVSMIFFGVMGSPTDRLSSISMYSRGSPKP